MDRVFGDYRLREREHDVLGPQGRIELSGRAVDLLAAFLDAPDALLTKDDLFAAAWPGVIVEDNTLQVHISALRKALGPGYLTTVHGRGYRYTGPPPLSTDQSVPARQSPEAPPRGNIERFEVRLVEREAELIALCQLLRTERLVTVLGPGGVGKTTLALAAAAQRRNETPQDIWVLDFAAVADGRFIEATLVQTLGVGFRAGSSPRELILEHLARHPSLLVFDNCEHVREGVAELVRAILANAHPTDILATSQVPLSVPNERIFRLKPFGAVGDSSSSAAFLADCLTMLGEEVSLQDRPALLRIGRRLDGVALALKMVASRAAAVGITAVDAELARELPQLTAEATSTRFPSLKASMEWSYSLLSSSEQKLFRRLGVFMGSFSLDAVRAVGGAEAETSFLALVQRSLVMRDTSHSSRYRLLETSRNFALEKLMQANEEQEARRAHAEFIRDLFARNQLDWETESDASWGLRVGPDADNLRGALTFAEFSQDHPLLVGLAGSSYRFFMQQNLIEEGLAHAERALAVSDNVPALEAARLRVGVASLARYVGLHAKGEAALNSALPVLRESPRDIAFSLALLLRVWDQIFGISETPSLFAELETSVAELPICKTLAWALVAIGVNHWKMGEHESGLARAEAGLAMFDRLDNPPGLFRAAINLAESLHHGGDTRRAISLAERYVPRIRMAGTSVWLGMISSNLTIYHLTLGEPELAHAPFAEAWRNTPHDGKFWHTSTLCPACELALARGRPDVAALLVGFFDHFVETGDDPLQATEARLVQAVTERLSTIYEAKELSRLRHQGRSLSFFEADHLVETTVLLNDGTAALASAVAQG